MKFKITTSIVASLFTSFVAAILINGCAETQTAANTKSLLLTAGFRVRTPQTPQQKELYAALPDSKVERARLNNKVFYVFKDGKAGVAYVGHEAEYQRYKQICQQQKIAQDFYMSENMDSVQVHRWYGEWGQAVVWR